MIRKVSDSPGYAELWRSSSGGRWQAECDRCGRPYHRAYRRQEWAVAAPRRAGWHLDATTVLCSGCAGQTPEDQR